MRTELLTNAPLVPPSPEDLHFGEEQNAWILSHHADVLAALRSKHLSQTGPVETTVGQGVKPERQPITSEIFTAFLNSHLAKWQLEMESLASEALQTLPGSRPVDLFAEFIRPWCLASAVALTGVNPIHSPRLAHLVSRLSISDAAPHDAIARSRAKEASRELDSFFPWSSTPLGKSMFLGVAQTVPLFLASAWAALVQYPSEWTSLRLHQDWISKGTEELLRYAGPVHSLFRKADSETSIRNTRLAAGDRVVLRLASANRDPLVFANPDLLDVKRNAAGHLALSSGSHYCMGASLVRMMTASATQATVARYARAEFSNRVEWSCGNMLIWPATLPVLLSTV